MKFENIFFAAIVMLCALFFIIMAIWAFKRKDPMHFWSGSTVKPEQVKDIPAYNRANGIMWLMYALAMTVAAFISLYSIDLGGTLLLIVSIPGGVVLVMTYKWIFKKYQNTSMENTRVYPVQKTPKAVKMGLIIISSIILIVMIGLFYYGEKDPDIIILDDRLQIEGMYGTNIRFNEILDIRLIDHQLSSGDFGRRTNGFNGFGRALKGYFNSDKFGEILIFVQSNSTKTIIIERINQRDILISFRDEDKTKQFYHDLIENLIAK